MLRRPQIRSRSTRGRALRVVTLLTAAVALAGGPGGEASPTSRVSVDSAGIAGDDDSRSPVLGAKGRVVAFESDATNLVAGDTNEVMDVFVHDRKTGATTRVSVGAGGVEGNNESGLPSISGNGRLIAFECFATNLVPDDTNGQADILVHDRKTGVTTRVSVGPDGLESNEFSTAPVISGNGRVVAFESDADNLVAGDTNGQRDVFVHDRKTGATTRVSVDSAGLEGDDRSMRPAISANGRLVVFESEASNLVAGDLNGETDVFVHDRKTGATRRVSVGPGGVEGGSESEDPSISANGRWVGFTSSATNLVPDDIEGERDIFVHELKTGVTSRASVDSTGVGGNNLSVQSSLSASGQLVTFASSATNLVADDLNSVRDIFVHDRKTGATTRVSVGVAGAEANNESLRPVLSASGRQVAFDSSATNLTAGADGNAAQDVFVHERD